MSNKPKAQSAPKSPAKKKLTPSPTAGKRMPKAPQQPKGKTEKAPPTKAKPATKPKRETPSTQKATTDARSPIENELLALVEVTVNDAISYSDYLRALVEEIAEVSDEAYETLSLKTQAWVADSILRMNDGAMPPDPRKGTPATQMKKRTGAVINRKEADTTGKKKYAPKGTVSYLIRDAICKNPDITSRECREMLQKEGYDATETTFISVFTSTRKVVHHMRAIGQAKGVKSEG